MMIRIPLIPLHVFRAFIVLSILCTLTTVHAEEIWREESSGDDPKIYISEETYVEDEESCRLESGDSPASPCCCDTDNQDTEKVCTFRPDLNTCPDSYDPCETDICGARCEFNDKYNARIQIKIEDSLEQYFENGEAVTPRYIISQWDKIISCTPNESLEFTAFSSVHNNGKNEFRSNFMTWIGCEEEENPICQAICPHHGEEKTVTAIFAGTGGQQGTCAGEWERPTTRSCCAGLEERDGYCRKSSNGSACSDGKILCPNGECAKSCCTPNNNQKREFRCCSGRAPCSDGYCRASCDGGGTQKTCGCKPSGTSSAHCKSVTRACKKGEVQCGYNQNKSCEPPKDPLPPCYGIGAAPGSGKCCAGLYKCNGICLPHTCGGNNNCVKNGSNAAGACCSGLTRCTDGFCRTSCNNSCKKHWIYNRCSSPTKICACPDDYNLSPGSCYTKGEAC